MANLMPGIPSLPGDETSWQAFTDQFETLKKGDKPISLTNWDDTDTVPAVAAGSALEIAGATYRFPSESAISAESGLAAGVVYVVVKTDDPDANSATAYFTNTAPEWRDDLNGWYDTTGAYRYTGHLMDWDGATAYTGKRVFTVQAKGGEVFTVGSEGDLIAGNISGATGTFVGGIDTDNITLKTRAYSGSFSDDEFSFPHNLDDAKIRAVLISFTSSSGLTYFADGGIQITILDSPRTEIDVNLGGSLGPGTWTAVIIYEA